MVGEMLLIWNFGIKLHFVNNFGIWSIRRMFYGWRVHEYYTKGRIVLFMDVPPQASWVVKKSLWCIKDYLKC